eukprot:TRINITY_DN73835_c0_g1_i1.p1 TRINITY_DN73835_c0_g1~~TRINITY_DN73835_c0_g1_i1.p1  ORF type:complete len:901 (-),score=307.31 TRINITY_DN73835_c0_g1_i1:148-2850(-)
MQFLLVHCLFLLRIVAGEVASKTPSSPVEPVALPDWATGWAPVESQVNSNTQRLMQIAREREQEATKALEEAKARERRAGMREAEAERELEHLRAQGRSVANGTIAKIHEASTAAVNEAVQEAAKARQRAENADRAADTHLARAKQQLAAMKSPADLEQASGEVIAALAAEDGAAGSSSPDAVSMAALAAPSGAVDAYTRLLQQLIQLAERARATGTVPELQAKLASEQVNVVKLQALRGSDVGVLSNDTQRVTYFALGGLAVGVFGLVFSFACRRQKSDTKDVLQEPLLASSPYKEPEWTNAEDTEAGIEDWRQRAVEAQQSLQKAKTALAEDEALKSSDREQLTITQQRVKELEAKEAETQQREENDARRQAETRAQMDRLKERLETAEAAVRRSDQESQSAQAAAQESQMRALEALAKVDLDAEEQKNRADELEGKLKEIQEAEAQLKAAQEAHKANFDQAQAQLRETKRELEEATAAVQEAKKEAAEVDVRRSSAEEQLEQQVQLTRQKSKEKRSLVEERQIQVQQLQEELEESKTQVQQLQEENKKLSAEIEKITANTSNLKQELEAMSQQGKETEGHRQQLQEEVQGLSEQVKKSADEKKRLQQQVEESQGLIARQREQLETAKAAAKDAAQALEAVRQQASAEITTGKKAAADLQAEKYKLQEALDQAQADVEVEKARANNSEQLAKRRFLDLEHAQQLTEKAKAQLQTVRQELSAECAAAKAQVDVERKLACEAEELAEKSRLDAVTARNAEQEARLAEQEAKAALTKMQKGSTSPRGEKELQASASAAADRWRKEIAAAQAETQEARAAEHRLKDELKAASVRDSQTQEALAQAKGELANMRALYAEATAAKTLAEQDLVQACGEATAAKEALKSMQDPHEAGDLAKAVGS